MNKLILLISMIGLFQVVLAQEQESEYALQFNPNEAESMVFLFNQTTVSGGDVEMVGALAAKLRTGMEQGRALQDTTQVVTLKLTPEEVQFCLGIIANSTFEARYAELVLGMKRKLEALLPPQSAVEEER